MDVVVIGAGPAGMVAALRAAELGAQTVLVTRGEVGGMAANDGPIPVRVLAHAARLLRNAGQLGRYGISVSETILDYPQLLARPPSGAGGLSPVSPSMIVVGGGATGVQVASIFQAFGSQVQLFEAGPRILPTEDEEVSGVVATAFRESGMIVRENFGAIDSFEKTTNGVRMLFTKDGVQDRAEAALVVVAVGWVADTA